MGTDIHLINKKKNQSGNWERLPDCEDLIDTYIHLIIEKKNQSGNWERLPDYEDLIDTYHAWEINYQLFARLADVRNGFGYPGCKAFEPYQPLFASKGFPEDFFLQGHEWIGDHSFTWAIVSDILAYDWTIKNKTYAVVDRSQYEDFKRDGIPSGFCGGVIGAGIIQTDNKELFESDESFDYLKIDFEYCPFENSGFLDMCRFLSDYYGGDNVRIIMGFDS